MLLLISPAKRLDFDRVADVEPCTAPQFSSEAEALMKVLRDYSANDLADLMHLSPNLAALNAARNQEWSANPSEECARPSLFAFRGDVFAGMGVDDFSLEQLEFAQSHLRILSGLYGLLRPLDLILPHRLEMGTKLLTKQGKNLYEFWGKKVQAAVQEQLESLGGTEVINLASAEYFKVVQAKKWGAKVITPVFQEKKGDAYKVVRIFAKKARGVMGRQVIQNRLTNPELLKDFAEDGYAFQPSRSDESQWIFSRG
jgi:cytoplasmic iron level regulating protein YaaA (DUF328/UPF0246 family)